VGTANVTTLIRTSTRRESAACAAALVAALVLGGCATGRAYRQGEKEMSAQNYDRAVLLFSKAVSTNPESTRYKVALSRAKMKAAQDHFAKGQAYVKAGRVEGAIAEFQQAVYLDPSHQYAANELSKALAEWQKQQKQDESDMEKLKRQAKEAAPGRVAPRLNPASNIPIVLRFKDETVKKIYDALSKASGINFIYDERLDLNKKISIDLADVTFEQALDTLMTMNKHFFKIWDENTILIADDNQQKHKEYDDLVIQTFYLSNADVKDVQVLLRTLLDARQLAQNDRLNAITIRDTPERVQVAQKIIESNDKAKSELIVDIELLEINRTAMSDNNWLFFRVARSPFTDATTGCKMFRRSDFERFRLESRPIGWAFAFEMAIKAQHLGLKPGEVPLVSIDRLFGGQSSFQLGSWLIEYLRWFLWGLRRAFANGFWRRRQIRIRVPAFYQSGPPLS